MHAWSREEILSPTWLSEPIPAPDLSPEPCRQQELRALFQGQTLPDVNRRAKPWITATPAKSGPPHGTHSRTSHTLQQALAWGWTSEHKVQQGKGGKGDGEVVEGEGEEGGHIPLGCPAKSTPEFHYVIALQLFM